MPIRWTTTRIANNPRTNVRPRLTGLLDRKLILHLSGPKPLGSHRAQLGRHAVPESPSWRLRPATRLHTPENISHRQRRRQHENHLLPWTSRKETPAAVIGPRPRRRSSGDVMEAPGNRVSCRNFRGMVRSLGRITHAKRNSACVTIRWRSRPGRPRLRRSRPVFAHPKSGVNVSEPARATGGRQPCGSTSIDLPVGHS